MSVPRRVAPQAPSRRGWCPSLARPMPTGDGLLARIHPPGGVLTAGQVRAIAEAARRHGNGLVDVTARSNLQLRGVTEATRGALALDLEAVGLGDTRDDGGPQRLTLTDTLAGLDPDGLIDAIAIARDTEAAGLGIAGLPAKILVAIEGGGRFGLDGAEGDVILRASRAGYVRIALAGASRPSGLAEIPADHAAQVVALILRAFVATGRRRMRDLSDDERASLAAAAGLPFGNFAEAAPTAPMPPPGVIALGEGSLAGSGRASCRSERDRSRSDPERLVVERGSPLLEGEGQGEVCESSGEVTHLTPPLSFQEREPVVAPATARKPDGSLPIALAVEAPFGRCSAPMLDNLADTARDLDSEAIRVMSTRGFLIVAPDSASARAAQGALATAGFVVAPDDPRRAVAACPGAPACASGSTPTLADAGRLAEAFRPFAALGLHAHVSGCAKGCAHPSVADLTLVGEDGRYGIVLHGAAGALPAMRMTFEAALDRVRRADPTLPLDQAFRTNP